ncbi:ABC transporter, permease protein (putative) [Microbacterium esteraromaticum]|uniref:ABC transporter, permease protein (Putative) n=1 Tax=Microbacterium esteraromaticum TaxID=57043 RepID=A0A1R4ILV8_9MICO|nr:DUF998 domain-containing protein [Microbacterium esteraromaticum]SJN20709.1 ABC transporter, permease protein (putative) [Microbacterium esteraromaticum]
MNDSERMLREQTRGLWATACCFVLGAVAGASALWGMTRPFAGDGSVMIPMALIAGVIAGAAFVVSTLLHRAGETSPMPRWQALVSDLSSIAVTIALIGVTGLGVLLAGEVLAVGLQGLELSAIGGGVLTAVAAALGGRLSFQLGVQLSTRAISALLFTFLIIGTLFAMITATDTAWWEHSFSQLGAGIGAWAFNGTLVIAGLLVATTGSYVGRDLHRMRGDDALRLIAPVVVIWALAGAGLAGVGLLPVDRMPVAHAIAAFTTLACVVTAAILTTTAVPAAPRMLMVLTIGLVALIAVAVVFAFAVPVLSITALESIVIGLVLLWMSTLARVLGILAPQVSRPSLRRSPLRG